MLNDLFTETWKELECGAKEVNHPFNICSLATFETPTQIKQRFVNLREVTKKKNLLFYTDNRSSKMDQIRSNPAASLVFYNPILHLQVFLRGKIILHTDDKLWEDHRLKIDGRSINDYNTKYPPGKKIKNPLAVKRTNDLNFALLEFVPTTIEYLKLRTEPNRLRALFTKKNEVWENTFLIP
jgi:pyridoxamine 5'-phosphate oxidase